jgi:hypothetical protein
MQDLTTAPVLDNPSRDDDVWALHPTIDEADIAAEAAYRAAEARRHEAAEAMIAAELDLFDEIPDEEWDRRAEESAWMDAYESACPPCY